MAEEETYRKGDSHKYVFKKAFGSRADLLSKDLSFLPTRENVDVAKVQIDLKVGKGNAIQRIFF